MVGSAREVGTLAGWKCVHIDIIADFVCGIFHYDRCSPCGLAGGTQLIMKLFPWRRSRQRREEVGRDSTSGVDRSSMVVSMGEWINRSIYMPSSLALVPSNSCIDSGSWLACVDSGPLIIIVGRYAPS